ncbi:hypothetical protein JYQ62_23430 [Nostoc sp. UHCC 0702]|nr:hypothetical protein JYQ62_23430 [Nostoc sp. UHCC 0702]
MEKQFLYTGFFILICLGIWLFASSPAFSILEQTPDKLVLRIRPTFAWAISTFLGGIALLFTIFVLQSTPITILNCKHSLPTSYLLQSHQELTSTNCELIAMSWLGKEANRNIFFEVQEAILEKKINSYGYAKIARYRATLLTLKGNIAITESYVSMQEPAYENMYNLVTQINEFIKNYLAASITIKYENKLLGYTGLVIAGCFWLITGLFIVTDPFVNCSFDKKVNGVILERRNLFGKKAVRCKLNDIKAVNVESYSDEGNVNYRINLLLISGEKLPLTQGLTCGWQEKQQIAEQIRQFMKNI